MKNKLLAVSTKHITWSGLLTRTQDYAGQPMVYGANHPQQQVYAIPAPTPGLEQAPATALSEKQREQERQLEESKRKQIEMKVGLTWGFDA